MNYGIVLLPINTSCRHHLHNLARRLISIKSRKIYYAEHGSPLEVLQHAEEEINSDGLRSNEVLIKWLASPINPADINQIQGVYPIKPPVPATGGNEGCAWVEKVGPGVREFEPGDVVIPAAAGIGTWSSHGIFNVSQLFPVDRTLDTIAASMLQVNPSTAYRMLKDFIPLRSGDLVVQNGANSAVGRFVIQICRNMGLNSINVVRYRHEIDQLKGDLKSLGATEVLTEEEFGKELRKKIGAKLALNCVGGRSSGNLIRALGDQGCMVTYGGMSKNPVQVPTSSLIFNNVTLHGFWMSRWYEDRQNAEERRRMYDQFSDWYKQGKLLTPPVRKWRLEQFREAIGEATEPKGNFKHVFVYK